jgi:hypothetical protein
MIYYGLMYVIMKRRDIIYFLLILVSGLALYVGFCKVMGYPLLAKEKVSYYPGSIKTGHEGDLIPSFDLLLSDSVTHISIPNEIYSGPIVLFYFGTDCPYCLAETKAIIKNINSLKGIQFYFIASSPISDLKIFRSELGLDRYSNMKLARDYELKFGYYFNLQSVPFIAIYGRDRKLRAAFEGTVSIDLIRKICED